MSKVIEEEDKNNEAQKKEEILDLDQVHERTLEDLERENEDDEKGDADTGADDDKGDDDSSKDEEAGDDNADDSDDGKDGGKPPVSEPVVKEEPKVEPTPELDGVEVKDYEGKVHKFKSFDDVPDDFEPQNYKEFARFTVAMNDKLANDKKREEERLAEEAEKDKQDRINQIRAGWDKDIEDLTKSKTLPADEKERSKVVEGVFDIINEHLMKDSVIDFAPAYEIYAYRQSKKESEAKHQEQIKDKKEKGGKIQGQNAPTPSKGRSYEAPPSGISLDQVHEQVLSDL